jgi:hypothetical protein
MLPCRLSLCTDSEPHTSRTHACTSDAAFVPCLKPPLLTQVSNAGDVLYVLPRGFRGNIAARSWRLRAEPAIKRVRHDTCHCACGCHAAGRSAIRRGLPSPAIGLEHGNGAARLLMPWRLKEVGACTCAVCRRWAQQTTWRAWLSVQRSSPASPWCGWPSSPSCPRPTATATTGAACRHLSTCSQRKQVACISHSAQHKLHGDAFASTVAEQEHS